MPHAIVLGDDGDAQIADLDRLRSLDHRIEARIERELHRLAALVLEVHAVCKLAYEHEAVIEKLPRDLLAICAGGCPALARRMAPPLPKSVPP